MEKSAGRMSDSTDGWKYVIVISKFMMHLLEASISKSFGVLIPEMVILFDTRLSLLGLICSFPVTWMLVACPIVAYLLKYDRVKPRGVAIMGALMSSATLIASGYTRDIRILGTCLAFNGLGMGMNFMPTLLLLNDYFPRRFVLMSTVTLFGSIIGILFVPLMTERCVREYGYTGAMLILGGLMLHSLAGAVAIIPPRDACSKKHQRMNMSALEELDSSLSTDGNNVDMVECTLPDEDNECKRVSPLASKSVTGCVTPPSNVDTDINIGTSGDSSLVVYKQTSQEEHIKGTEVTRPDKSGNVKEPQEENKLFQRENDNVSPAASEERVDKGSCLYVVQWLRNGIFIKDGLFTLTLPTHLLIQYGAYAWMLFLVPRAEWLGVTSDKAVLLSTIGGIGALIGRLVLFVILYFNFDAFHICCVASTIAAMTFLLDSMVESFPAMCAMAFVQGWTIFTNTAIPPAFCKTTTSPSNFGLGCGYSALVGGLGGNIGGVLSGVIFDLTQSYTVVFISIGGVHCLILFNVIIYLVVQRRRKHQHDHGDAEHKHHSLQSP